MRVYASQLKVRAKVMDLDTQRPVKGVIWVDEDVGTAEAYRYDADGNKLLTLDAADGAAAWQTVLLSGRFKLVVVTRNNEDSVKVVMGAPSCAKCGSVLTLRGDDLCPKCKARDAGRPVKAERCHPLEMRRCARCSRDATWSVIDEVEVTPQESRVTTARRIPNGRYVFGRCMQVGRRYYCSKHYVGPRLLDHRGEVIETQEGGMCPDTIGR